MFFQSQFLKHHIASRISSLQKATLQPGMILLAQPPHRLHLAEHKESNCIRCQPCAVALATPVSGHISNSYHHAPTVSHSSIHYHTRSWKIFLALSQMNSIIVQTHQNSSQPKQTKYSSNIHHWTTESSPYVWSASCLSFQVAVWYNVKYCIPRLVQRTNVCHTDGATKQEVIASCSTNGYSESDRTWSTSSITSVKENPSLVRMQSTMSGSTLCA